MQSDLADGTLLQDRYRLLRRLGQGGNGTTYAAKDCSTGKTVAIKVLALAGLHTWKQLELFEREAKVLQSLDHPGIPDYLDYFQVSGDKDQAFCLVQELARGQSLAARVERGWHGEEAEAKRIARAILDILSYLHSLHPPIIHRDLKPENMILGDDGQLFLVDSGGQYDDGTTDITRTVAIGAPPLEAIQDFTLVLKGHIAIAMTRFPEGTRGVDLDVLARMALWQRGKDYAHGTGHGVGSYLNVHEGPQNISKRGMEALVPGMIISNEPGYYVEGEYGIRIENLVLVREAETMEGGNIKTHWLETLTLAPIDLNLVDATLLNEVEREWLNAYHRRVRETISAHLDKDEQHWLDHATREI